jgi:hypothetical protein
LFGQLCDTCRLGLNDSVAKPRQIVICAPFIRCRRVGLHLPYYLEIHQPLQSAIERTRFQPDSAFRFTFNFLDDSITVEWVIREDEEDVKRLGLQWEQ